MMSKTTKIPLIARKQKNIYTAFFIIITVLFVLTSLYTNFNVFVLLKNSDAFIQFIVQDFFPPALPKASALPEVFSNILITLALAMSSTTIAAVLAFFMCFLPVKKSLPSPILPNISAALPLSCAIFRRLSGHLSSFLRSASARV